MASDTAPDGFRHLSAGDVMRRIGERVDVVKRGTNWRGEYVELAALDSGELLLWVQPNGKGAKQLGLYGARREESALEHFAAVMGAN